MTARAVAIAKGRFFYGWLIAATGFIVQATLSIIDGYGIGVFLKSISDEMGWSRATISGSQSFGTLIYGLVSPFVGPIVDRRGARLPMLLGAIIVGAGVVALGFLHGIADLYVLRGVIIPIGIACGGSTSVSIAVSNWFVRKRGRAVALSAMGVGFGGMVIAPLAAYLIGSYGWRTSWVILGVTIWVLVIPPVALLMRRRPEDIGLLPDGDCLAADGLTGETKGSSVRNLPSEQTWTRQEAVRTRALWLTILAFGLAAMGSGSIALHIIPYLTDLGFLAAVAAAAASVRAASTFFTRPVWGIFIDRHNVRHCAAAAIAFCSAGMGLISLLSLSPALWLVFLAAVVSGVGQGGMVPIQEVLWANYYGRLNLGSIRTIATPFSFIFAAGGPFFAGWIFDTFRSYQLAFAIFTGTYFVAAILVFLARPPKKALAW